MKVMVLGATGYTGRPTARALQRAGHAVAGLARSAEAAAALVATGVEPIMGDARRPEEWLGQTGGVDAIITLLAQIDFREEGEIYRKIIEGFGGPGRTLIVTTGSAIVSVEAHEGQWDENAFAEDDPFPFPDLAIRKLRLPTETMVRAAGTGGFRTMVVRPPMIYGHGGSTQVPGFFESGLELGFVTYVGAGLNLYSNVHVDDLAEIYPLALERGVNGALYHAVGGEACFREVAEAAGQVLGMEVRSMPLDELCRIRHPDRVRLGIAVNSRTRSPRARAELGWAPTRCDMIADIRNGSYRAKYGQND